MSGSGGGRAVKVRVSARNGAPPGGGARGPASTLPADVPPLTPHAPSARDAFGDLDALRILEASRAVDFAREPSVYGAYAATTALVEFAGDYDMDGVRLAVQLAASLLPRVGGLLPMGRDEEFAVMDALSTASSRWDLLEPDLLALVQTLGDDVALASAVLHVVNADRYPLLDARVFRFVTGRPPRGAELDDRALYAGFTRDMRDLAASVQAVQVAKQVRRAVPEAGRMFALSATMCVCGAGG